MVAREAEVNNEFWLLYIYDWAVAIVDKVTTEGVAPDAAVSAAAAILDALAARAPAC